MQPDESQELLNYYLSLPDDRLMKIKLGLAKTLMTEPASSPASKRASLSWGLINTAISRKSQ